MRHYDLIPYSKRFPQTFAATEHAKSIASHADSGKALLDLTVSNPTRTISEYPHREIGAALGSVCDFSYAPDPFGALAARECLAEFHTVNPDRVALTASTSEAYSLLFKLLCDPDDEVLVPVPSYPLFEHLARFDSVRVETYPLRYDGAWYIDFAVLEERVSARTRAIVVVNPNNPTGSFLKTDEVQRLLGWAAEHNVAILSDEVFRDYRWSDSARIVDSLWPFSDALSFSLHGLSKSSGMPQMKLAWIVINGPEAEIARLRPRMELLLDTYLSVNKPVQSALRDLLSIGALVRQQLTATIQANLAYLRKAIAIAPLHCLDVEGGWTAILQLPAVAREQEWVRMFLANQSVLVQPGYFFDMLTEPHIVVSLITPPKVFQSGLERLITSVRARVEQ